MCIRQEAGFCCVEYTPCEDMGSMSISPYNAGAVDVAGVDTDCSLDYIAIEGKQTKGDRTNQRTGIRLRFRFVQ